MGISHSLWVLYRILQVFFLVNESSLRMNLHFNRRLVFAGYSQIYLKKFADNFFDISFGLRQTFLWNENHLNFVNVWKFIPSCAIFIGRSLLHLQKLWECLSYISQIDISLIKFPIVFPQTDVPNKVFHIIFLLHSQSFLLIRI